VSETAAEQRTLPDVAAITIILVRARKMAPPVSFFQHLPAMCFIDDSGMGNAFARRQ
jgi:hypothetical protein